MTHTTTLYVRYTYPPWGRDVKQRRLNIGKNFLGGLTQIHSWGHGKHLLFDVDETNERNVEK